MTAIIGRLAAERETERWRRDLGRAARAHAQSLGYDGTVLVKKSRYREGHEITLQQDIAIEAHRLRAPVNRAHHAGNIKDMVGHLVDLALLSRRRRAAIEANGGSINWPPAWSYLGHPVARGLYAAMGHDLTEWCPSSDGNRLRGVIEGLCFKEFRISTSGARARVNGVTIKVHAADEIARVIIDQRLPETIITGMPGRPLHQVLGLPGILPGSAAGEAPIITAKGGDATVITVECALEPMGTPPADADLSFLTEWKMRHRI